MAHAFQTISSKPTFGTLRENLYQSDYINRKKGIFTYCKSRAICHRIKTAPSYNTRNAFNTGRLTLTLDKFAVNKSNLIIGQYTKTNLTNICTVSNIFPYFKPTPCGSDAPCNPCQNNDNVITNTSNVFYQQYRIDPLGELFGKLQCGELNYTHYMHFYPPPKPLTLENSSDK